MAFEEHGTRLLDMAMSANMFKPEEPDEKTDDKTKEGTEFQHNLFPHRLLDTGQEIIVIVVKRTYEINLQGKSEPSTEQFEVLAGDIFFGNDPMRSVRFEKDFVPYKYGCDVVVNGRAYAPQGFPTKQFDVTFRLGSYEKKLRIIGKRTAKWVEPPPPPPPPKDLKEGEEPPPPPPPPPPEISAPEPIASVPLRWEYAYGGKSLYFPPNLEPEEEEQPPEDPEELKKWEKEKKKKEKEEEKEKKKKKKKGEEEAPEEEKPKAKAWDSEKMMPGKAAQKASADVAAGKKNWDFEPTPKAPSVKDAKEAKQKGDKDKDKKEGDGDAGKERVLDPKDIFFRKESTMFLDINKLDEEKEKEEARRFHQKLAEDHDEVKKKTDTKEGVDWMSKAEKPVADGQADEEGKSKKRSRAEMIRDYLLKEGHDVDTDSTWEKPDQEVGDGQTRVLQIGTDDTYEGFDWVAPYMKPVEKQKTQEEELEEGIYRVPYFRNDLGKGFILHNTPEVVDGTELPNIEDPEHLLTPENLVADLQAWQDQPVPAGFGVYKVGWFPRAGYAGCPPYLMDVANQNIDFCKSQLNMDELDPEQRKVIDEIEYPEMKLQFYNCAAMGLTFHKLYGDEEITLLNMTNTGRLTFKLPGEVPFVTLDIGGGPMDVDCPLDTVYIMPDEMKVVCVWRGHTTEFPGVDRWQEMEKCEVTVNRMTPAQMAAARAKAQKPDGGTMVLNQDDLRKLEMEEAELKYRGMRRDAVDRDGTHVIFVEEGDSAKAERQYVKEAEKEAAKGKGTRKKSSEGTKMDVDIADLPEELPEKGHVDDVDKDK